MYGIWRKGQGFTLIELVITVTILGILGGMILPRFATISDKARENMVNGVAGGISAAVMVMHARYITDGSPGAGSYIKFEGIDVRFNSYGWPDNTRDSSHVPTGIPNPDRTTTRLWFGLTNTQPTNIIQESSTGTGWYMTADGTCGADNFCWDYKNSGTWQYRVTYNASDGEVTISDL